MINKTTAGTSSFLRWSRWLAWMVGPLFGLGFLTLLWKKFQKQPAKKNKKPESRRDPTSERLIKECAQLIDELATHLNSFKCAGTYYDRRDTNKK